jgi:ferredoxin
MAGLKVGDRVVVGREGLQQLIDTLRALGYRVIGPRVREGAIIYDEVLSVGDLPEGWRDEQDGGRYRLKRRGDQALFGYNLGPDSWKRYLFPPTIRLWRAVREGKGFKITPNTEETPRYAFLGVRACEIAAIAVQDKVFLQGDYVDPIYQARRKGVFVVAVNCTQAGGTCFCTSMGTGPKATGGYDLALTEVLQDGRHYFVVEVGSELGLKVLEGVEYRAAGDGEVREAERRVEAAAHQMGRTLETAGIKELLYASYEHPRWDEVAERCLTCGNCTLVCPTCFCNTIEETTSLDGQSTERWRVWDSCFNLQFTYIHGGSVRTSPKSRYRQWLTHKLATWIDQFGVSGCVGCGRCITWCPVGIDLTGEVKAIRESQPVGR